MYGTVLKHVQDPTFIGSNNPMEYIEDYISRYVKKATPQDIYEVQCRLRAVDATTIQLHGYYTTAEYLSYNGIVNLYDPKSVKEINNQYFRSCPLDLIVL